MVFQTVLFHDDGNTESAGEIHSTSTQTSEVKSARVVFALSMANPPTDANYMPRAVDRNRAVFQKGQIDTRAYISR